MDASAIKRQLPPHLTLVGKLGGGGFATVYRVRNSKLEVDWALKVLDANKMSSASGKSKALKEAQITARIHHTNVVTIHDVDEVNGFIFMELVDGPSFSSRLELGLTSWREYRGIAEGVLAGLAAAHRQGVIHGDMSPRNILLTPDGIPKLVDFGLARHGDFSCSSIGLTPGYASPEHVLNKRLTFQSDVFSTGALLYQLATGQHPYEWENHFAYSYAILNDHPREPRIGFSDAPPFLVQFLLRALSTEQAHRYTSGTEMEQAFRTGYSRDRADVSHSSSAAVSQSARAWRHYHRGQEYYHGSTRQEMDWAEDEFRAALRCDPSFSLAYAGLADVAVFRYMSYFDRSLVALSKAEHYCQQALERDPSRPQHYRSLGRIFMMRREFDEARQNYSKAIELDPDYMAAHIALAWCGVESQDMVAAEHAAMAARAIDADNLEAALLLARIYYYQKDYDRSIAIANEAIKLKRNSGRAHYDLAMAQRALGEFDNARQSFRMSLNYQGDPNTLNDLGVLELSEKDYNAAADAFALASQDEAFAFLGLYYLGFTYYLAQKTTSAQDTFRQSLEQSQQLSKRDPIDPYPRIVGAMATAALGDADRARTLMAMSVELDPNDGLVAYYGACALSWIARPDEVESALQPALTLPRSPSRIEASLDPHFTRLSK
ncbi:MAG: protein kinase [candidate division Zixibacteria bacterium]|nr:protein kinase [candidate division Zixibacteria bacterium]